MKIIVERRGVNEVGVAVEIDVSIGLRIVAVVAEAKSVIEVTDTETAIGRTKLERSDTYTHMVDYKYINSL
jgi:hypothetical protein